MIKRRRILVVDDSEVMLDRIRRALTAAGYEVVATSQVVGNARFLRTCELVILDYHMPGMNGAEVVASMRSIANSPKNMCSIFLYTSDEGVTRSFKELGFDGVFTNKGDEATLVRQVASFFRLADMSAARRARERP